MELNSGGWNEQFRAAATDGGRSPRSRDTRQRIVGAAARLFEIHGYTATSMEDISAEADVSRATVYYQFPSKESLYTYLCVEYANRSMGYVEHLESKQITATERVVELVWNLVASTLHEPTVRLLFDTHATVSSESKELIRAAQHRYVDALERALMAAQTCGAAFRDDPKVMALALFESIGRTRHWFDPRGRLSSEEAGPVIVRMFLRAVLTPSAAQTFEDRLVAAGRFFPSGLSLLSLEEAEDE